MDAITIDIKLLRAFVAVAAEGSFLGAAKRLSCSQGAVSTRVGFLEDRIGSRVFDRRGLLGVLLTDAGRELLPDAEALLALHDKIVFRARTGNRRYW